MIGIQNFLTRTAGKGELFMTLGEKLVKLRRSRGLSQDQLAEMLAVSRQSVSKWERDESQPELSKLAALSDIFGVTTDYLLKDDPKQYSTSGADENTDAGRPESDGNMRPGQNAGTSSDYSAYENVRPDQYGGAYSHSRSEEYSGVRSNYNAIDNFLNYLLHLLKTKGYLLGYIFILLGVLDIITYLVILFALSGFHGIGELAGNTALISAPARISLMTLIYGGVKIVIGVLIVIFGKRWCQAQDKNNRTVESDMYTCGSRSAEGSCTKDGEQI